MFDASAGDAGQVIAGGLLDVCVQLVVVLPGEVSEYL